MRNKAWYNPDGTRKSGNLPAPPSKRTGHWPPELLRAKKTQWLEAFGQFGVITKACEVVGISRDTWLHWLHRDPAFLAHYQRRIDEAAERLEVEARRRAVDGYLEPVYQQGRKIGTIRRYSDILLIFLLKGAKPETYKERFVQEHTGKDGAPLSFTLRPGIEPRAIEVLATTAPPARPVPGLGGNGHTGNGMALGASDPADASGDAPD